VREVWIHWHDQPNVWVDISETVEQKAEALRQHKSQVGEDVVKMVKQWALEEGKGLAPAESYKVIYLEKREEKKDEA
jgi:LmbE family N-acetylglucosaminyl deacetylase